MRNTWTESDALRLRELREKAGLTQQNLAKRHLLSSGQIRELEGEKSGSFYSENIKVYAGHKLLASLGYVAPPEPTPDDLISHGPENPVATDPERESLSPEPESPPALEIESMPAAPAPKSGRGPAVALALGVLIALVVIWVLKSTKSSATAASVLVTEPVSVARPEPVLAVVEPPLTEVAQKVEASAPAKGTATADAGVTGSGVCGNTPTRGPTQYQSPVADKPSNYLYVQALIDAHVCLADSNKQTLRLTLRAGESFNMTGTAPFIVQSTQWQDLKIFFQGLRVKLEPGAATDHVMILPHQGT